MLTDLNRSSLDLYFILWTILLGPVAYYWRIRSAGAHYIMAQAASDHRLPISVVAPALFELGNDVGGAFHTVWQSYISMAEGEAETRYACAETDYQSRR